MLAPVLASAAAANDDSRDHPYADMLDHIDRVQASICRQQMQGSLADIADAIRWQSAKSLDLCRACGVPIPETP